jgi:SAM-dependent methyltransferase
MPTAGTTARLTDFSSVTETNEAGLTRHAFAMNLHRYRLALDFCDGKDVLEVACGAGQGLGYLAKRARSVVGGDFTETLAKRASAHYGDRLPVLRFDGQSLPFHDRSFDVVVFFEALYYLPQPEKFLSEVARVLRPGGVLLISTINPEWSDFNPSPLSTRYYTASALAALLEENGFAADIQGAFPVEKVSRRDAVVSLVKRMAVSVNMVPGSMKGKTIFKRIFYGKLTPLPPELEENGTPFDRPQPIQTVADPSRYRVIYAVARPRGPKESL